MERDGWDRPGRRGLKDFAELMSRVADELRDDSQSAGTREVSRDERYAMLVAARAARILAREVEASTPPTAEDQAVRAFAEDVRGEASGVPSDALRLLKRSRRLLHDSSREAAFDPDLPLAPQTFVDAFFDAAEIALVESASAASVAPAAPVPAEECDFYASLFEDLPIPVWRTDARGDLTYANRAWLRFTGRDIREQLGSGWLQCVAADERGSLATVMRDALQARHAFRFEYHLYRYDGVPRWVETQASPVHDPDGEFVGYVGWTTDLTEHRQQEAQLAFMATHDPLTGLPNRRMLEEPLKRAVARARRGIPSALLMLDLDNFKYFNDSLGHVEGDQALVNLALLLQTHVRAGDLLVRLGGDEFAVLLEGASPDEAIEIAERMRDAAGGEFVPHARDFGLSISLGLLMIDGRIDYRRLLGYADSAMYRAKESGRNRIVLHTPGDEAEHAPTGATANLLRDAFRNDLFVLHFQPIVRLPDRSLDYYEALIRLRVHDENGDHLLRPGEFLPAAMRFGLVPKLTRWVVDAAIDVLAEDRSTCVSVNLSAMDLADDRLADDIATRLARAKVQPSRLLFEMQEGVITQDLPGAERLLGALSTIGCRLILEDFGRAFTSLGVLKGLPVDHVKIDCSLVCAFEHVPGQVALMSAVRTLAESQGRQVVAECVETEAEFKLVRDAGFEYGQGNFLGEPAPLPEHARA